MKTIFIIATLFLLAGCNKITVTESDLNEALISCDSFGGISEINVFFTYANGSFIESICSNNKVVSFQVGKKNHLK